MLVLAIDLTTLATAEGSSGYAYWINREFELGIDEADIAQVGTFRAFAALPQARSFFARAHLEPALSQQIEEVIDAVDPLDPRMLRSLLPVPGAVESVQTLAARQQILYVTRRPRGLEQVSRAWLQRAGFPHAERLFFCQSDAEKWLHATSEAEAEEAILLLDSQFFPMVAAYRQFCRQLPDQARRSQGRAALLVFGQMQIPVGNTTPLPVHSCPDWSAVATAQASASI
jgi:hypothetical protein